MNVLRPSRDKTIRAGGLCAIIMSLLTVGHAAGQTLPAAIGSDPPADMQHPASTAGLLIPSHGVTLDARLYSASGQGPHPTLVMFDGLPGWHTQADIDMAVRRAGWHVLVFHYRGLWGAPGKFSIRHSMEDAAAAVNYIRRPEVAAKYGIDTRRLVVAGHSMGGFCAAALARTDPGLAGAILIDAWDVGEEGKMLRHNPKMLRRYAMENFGDMGHAAGGASPLAMAREVQATTGWDYVDWARSLAGRPLLIIGARDGNGNQSQALADAIRRSDARQLEAVVMPTDHSFSDHRIALTEKILAWLDHVRPLP
ncbi:alpha/beta hydrolase family protein [Phenylobacterium sp.]|uniref:alpha/beta hydrolase family protein n=1 Tax=Phenylobacterium sp. TaxID=1871053 RepID=UPI002DE3B40A|nr:alpha/beta fold hydrolase [Phenylobacterium sp.]